MAKKYEDRLKEVPFLQEKLWKLAEKKTKKDKGRKNFDHTLSLYKDMVVSRRSPRRVFDKKLLCFKVNNGTKDNPDWDFSITAEMIKKKKIGRDYIFRTVKHITAGKCETFADVLKMRCDWLIPDGQLQWGTDESIRLSIENCKQNLKDLSNELEALGFERYDFVGNLSEENRTGQDEQTLVDKLSGLGLKKKKGDQLNLF